VKRIEGRVQCFTFVKDEGFELDEHEVLEHEVLVTVE